MCMRRRSMLVIISPLQYGTTETVCSKAKTREPKALYADLYVSLLYL